VAVDSVEFDRWALARRHSGNEIMAHIRTHPGEILREEFMMPLGLSANALALALRVPATRIGESLRADKPRAVTADTAMRLARYFGTTPEFWINLQAAYDLSRTVAEHGAAIERDVQPRDGVAA
jgi:addiction module HigA family antidote